MVYTTFQYDMTQSVEAMQLKPVHQMSQVFGTAENLGFQLQRQTTMDQCHIIYQWNGAH